MNEQTLVDYLTAHQAMAPLIAMGLGVMETTAFVSAFVPSTALLIAVGAAASTGAFPLFPIWVGATIGALIGSTVSFVLGRVFGEALLGMRPLVNHPGGVARTRDLFARWGGFAILIGHFFGPLRSIVFLFAGMSGMRTGKFLVFNIIGAAAWAYVIPKSGELGGDLFAWARHFLGY